MCRPSSDVSCAPVPASDGLVERLLRIFEHALVFYSLVEAHQVRRSELLRLDTNGRAVAGNPVHTVPALIVDDEINDTVPHRRQWDAFGERDLGRSIALHSLEHTGLDVLEALAREP